MGLDTSHGCWHGAYSAFMRWRIEIAKAAGIPLPLMEGFFGLDEYIVKCINNNLPRRADFSRLATH